MNTATLENTREVIYNVHAVSQCTGRPCPVHNRTDHHMRHMMQHFRSDRGLMERICEHGVGHPDPDDIYAIERGGAVHGCDGCCRAEK